MVARTCIYLLVLSSLRLPWCIEQPASSLLEAHPLFSFLLKKFTIYRAAWLVSHVSTKHLRSRVYIPDLHDRGVHVYGCLWWRQLLGCMHAWSSIHVTRVCTACCRLCTEDLKPRGLKPTFIYSNYKYISELNIPLPDHVCFSSELCTRLLGVSCSCWGFLCSAV